MTAPHLTLATPANSSAHRAPANRPMALAGALAFATLAVHIGVGTERILEPTLTSDAPAAVRETMRACWHMVTLALAAMAASYGYAIRRRTPALVLTWNLLAAAFGIVFLVIALDSGLGFGEVPQSIAFFAITVAGFAGLRQSLYLRPAAPTTIASRRTTPTPDRTATSHPAPH